MPEQEDTHWVGTWTTTPAPVEGVSLCDQTLRMIAHVSIGGRSLRVRLTNACGTSDLAIGAAHVALRHEGASILPGSDRTLTFHGSRSTAIAAGALVVSDPVELEVPPLADLVVSIHLPGDVPDSFLVTGRGNAH